jgi:hypothetical protein
VETARGEYEAGTFTTGEPEFSYRFEVDEKAGRAKLTEMIRLVNKTVIDVGVEYVIVASEDGASASGTFLLSESRRNQRILTAKRQLGRKSCAYCAIAVSRSAVRRRGAIS